jgi:hypothetical protein
VIPQGCEHIEGESVGTRVKRENVGPLGHLLHVSPVSTRLPFLLCKEGYLHGNLLRDSEQEGDKW